MHTCSSYRRALAYKKYQHLPLYLEWAPAGIFSLPPPPPLQPAEQQQEQQRQAKEAAAKAAKGGAPRGAGPSSEAGGPAAAGADADDEAAPGSVSMGTIYVKNLAFATTDPGTAMQWRPASCRSALPFVVCTV